MNKYIRFTKVLVPTFPTGFRLKAICPNNSSHLASKLEPLSLRRQVNCVFLSSAENCMAIVPKND